MPNIFQRINNVYKKSNQTFQQSSLIILLIGFGALILFYINNKSITPTTDNIYATFACPLTAQDKIVTLDTSALKTTTDLTLINNDTELYNDGVYKNQIPAVYLPKFVNYNVVSPCIQLDDQVLVLQYMNTTRIYPKSILNYHIAVNDVIADKSFLITYSPLANHFQVYDRSLKTDVLTFGVSGQLYKNNELLFDTKTETLWSQLDGKALVGSMIGGTLTKYPFSILSLAAARKAYPSAQYLSFETGYLRDYTLDPFKTYAGNDKQIAEQASNISDKLDYKATILGFSSNSIKYALDINSVTDNTTVFYKTDTSSFSVKKIQGGYQILDAKGKKLDYEELYWFVWFDVNPGTILLQPAT